MWFGFVPLCVEVIVVEFGFVPCLLYRGGSWREELCTPNPVLANSSMEVPCVDIVEILLCEGGDIEQ